MPTYHPAYLLRNYSTENRTRVWEDMKKVMAKHLGKTYALTLLNPAYSAWEKLIQPLHFSRFHVVAMIIARITALAHGACIGLQTHPRSQVARSLKLKANLGFPSLGQPKDIGGNEHLAIAVRSRIRN
jgi:hypothetical protein